MSLPLAITLNLLAAIVLLAGLAYAMTRTMLLKPHVASLGQEGQRVSAKQAFAPQQLRRSAGPSSSARARRPVATSSHAVPLQAAAHDS